MLTLYHCPRTRSARALWMLEEIGCSYALKLVNLRAGEGRSAAYRQLNPHGKVPTLVHDAVVIPDSTAILLYLADAFPAAHLAPALDDPQRGTYLAWMTYTCGVIEPALAARHKGFEYEPSRVAWGAWEDILGRLQQGATGAQPYLLGERFSAADILIGGAIEYGLRAGDLPQEPAFVRYAAQCAARPAWKRAQAKDDAMATASHTLKEAHLTRSSS
jgi:glutathione S-transferase